MRIFLAVALIHAVSCGHVNIQMPYLNPAGVTYVSGSVHAGLAAGPAAYTTVTARPFAYSQPLAQHVSYSQPIAHPVAYSQPIAHHVAPVAYQAYQPVTKYAAVPTVHHVQGVADVPITRYEAQPAVIQKAVDVAKPAIKTRKYEIRRPAIQKQFYDIEERIVVRPAGSALVELDQPTSKTQKGNAVISPAAYAIPAVHAYKAIPTVHAVPAVKAIHAVPAYARLQPFSRFAYTPFATQFQLSNPQITVASFGKPLQPQQPQQPQQPEGQQPEESPEQPQQPEQPQSPYPFEQPQPQQPPQQPEPQQQQQQEQPQADDEDSVSVDNPEFSARSAPEATSAAPEQEPAAAEAAPSSAPAPENAEEPQARPTPEARSVGGASLGYSSPLDLIPQARSGPSLVPSLRNLPADISQANQEKLIQLLTARGGVTEVGIERSGPSISPVGEAGQVRARVLSATPAPPSAEPTGERVNTRRVVVSRPIETLQEIEVQEPVTKLERIHVQHPTFIKTARQDVVRVPTSVPVYGKALAPVAHAAVPVGHAVPAYSTYYG